MEDNYITADIARKIRQDAISKSKMKKLEDVKETIFFQDVVDSISAAAMECKNSVAFTPHPQKFYQDYVNKFKIPHDEDREFSSEEMKVFEVLEESLGFKVDVQPHYQALFVDPHNNPVVYNINNVTVYW